MPTKFAPEPKCEVIEGASDKAELFEFSVSSRGTLLRLPIDPSAGVYGFGLQLKSFQQRGLKKHLRPNADPVSNSGDTHAPVRALVCDYQDERELWDVADEYLFGDSMVVCPMTAAEKERDIILPRNNADEELIRRRQLPLQDSRYERNKINTKAAERRLSFSRLVYIALSG